MRIASSAAASPALGGVDDRLAVADAALAAEAVERRAGGEVLQRAGLRGLVSGVGRAVAQVGADDDVAELGRGAGARRGRCARR